MKIPILIVTACVFVFSACSKQELSYMNKAEEMYKNVWYKYRVREHQLFSEYYPNDYRPNLSYFQDSTKQAKEVSFLWPMSGVFSSTNLLMELDSSKYKPYLDSMVMAVEKYYDSTRKPAGYQAYPVALEYSDRYYDDNGLVGIDYVDAYNITRKPEYLQKAEEVMEFIMSGWSDDFDGGVSWLEGIRDQKPACSNGKATVLSIKLHQATSNQKYLDYGIQYYDWMMNTLLDDSLNIIWNSLLIKGDASEVQKHAYTYNTGTMIQSAVRLYHITSNQKYLDDARKMAEGSFAYYVKYSNDGVPYIRDLPWFVIVLFRGYHELFEIDQDPKYVSAIIASADYGWNNARDAEGLFYNSWMGNKDEEKHPKWLLDEACMAELFARAEMIKRNFPHYNL